MAFSIGRVLDLLVPDIPGSVEIKVKRECYLAKQALAENEVSAPPPVLCCCPAPPLPFPENRLFLEQTGQKRTSPWAQR